MEVKSCDNIRNTVEITSIRNYLEGYTNKLYQKYIFLRHTMCLGILYYKCYYNPCNKERAMKDSADIRKINKYKIAKFKKNVATKSLNLA